MPELYFAYGSCMNLKDLQRTTAAKFVSSATLYDYRLAFTRYSAGRKGGVADVVRSSGDFVEGVLFEVPNMKKLDIREGHPFAYKRRKIKVLVHKRMQFVSVWTYAVTKKSKHEFAPSRTYQALIESGARAYLSDVYQDILKDTFSRFNDDDDLDADWELFKQRLHSRLGVD